MLNGDETFHNSRLRVFGRVFETEKEIVTKTEPDAYSPATKQVISTPGIYKVVTYQR